MMYMHVHNYVRMLCTPNRVKVDGITYQKPSAVLLGVDDDYPLFSRLDDMFIILLITDFLLS